MRIRSDGEQTRGRILEAACAVFGEKGYHKATFAEMGRRGDFAPALISFHFRSKDDLYRAVWLSLEEQIMARCPVDGGLGDDAPPEERLRSHVRAALKRSCDAKLASFHQIHMQERVNPTGLLDEELHKLHQANQCHMRTLVGDLLGSGATSVDIDLCEMSIVNQFSILRPPGSGQTEPRLPPNIRRFSSTDVKRLTEHIICFCLGGLRNVRQMIAERGTASQ